MMKNKKLKKKSEAQSSIVNAERTLHEVVSQQHPEWIDKNGECNSCVSLEHEMAANPNFLPEDFQ